MKMLLLLILLSISIPAFSPEQRAIILSPGERICPFERLITAIVQVESSGGKQLFNKKENSIGPFQVRKIRVVDYNQRTGSNYKHEDFYSYELSRKMFLYYAKGKTFEQAAKSWNGSSKKNEKYWQKVKQLL